MSDQPSRSNDHLDEPRRSIGPFLILNAAFTTAGTVAVALTSDNPYLLYPLAFALLVGGVAIIFREMFRLLGEDSQYAPEAVIAGATDEVAPSEQPRTISRAPRRSGASLHTA